ncbi:hypothetical protein [Antiquaquibacter soli]|uniref:Uncharacterized protein n=1 Tax=Antiquaquibacter soli TaxID=3064523 RepID=A0ABT9BQD2_9MICO|nr:hypothetical protein [Protaetiibacter sp. WY-16]MDO7882637.1 hypothetical protein [Protaetiibacter sp. WY-16]
MGADRRSVGTGALINWIDVHDSDYELFEEWYLGQHLEERVGVPGFIRGRRFRAVDERSPGRYLTVYTTGSVDVLASAPYLARLNSPTELTREVVAKFALFRRAAARITARDGLATSGRVAVIELDPETTVGVAEVLESSILPQARESRQILSALFFEPDTAATAAKASTQEGQAGTESLGPALLVVDLSPVAEPSWLVGVQRRLEQLGATVLEPARLYDLIVDLSHDALQEGLGHADR